MGGVRGALGVLSYEEKERNFFLIFFRIKLRRLCGMWYGDMVEEVGGSVMRRQEKFENFMRVSGLENWYVEQQQRETTPFVLSPLLYYFTYVFFIYVCTLN